MYNAIMQKAMANTDKATFVEGDYYKPYFDDEPELKVIVCGVCGKPKECYPRIPTEPCLSGHPPKDKRLYPFGRPVKVACLCDCEVDKRKKAEQEQMREKTAIQRKIDCWGYENENGEWCRNYEMEKTSFDNKLTTDNLHIKACKKYIATISKQLDDCKGLFLCGKSSAGKTYATMCLANAVMDRMFKCQFREQWQIIRLNQYKDINELKKLESCTFLIIDDFNPDKLDDYGREKIFSLFETRIARGLPTIFTSNAKEQNIRSPINSEDIRIMERIVKNCYIVEDSSHNYRI